MGTGGLSLDTLLPLKCKGKGEECGKQLSSMKVGLE